MCVYVCVYAINYVLRFSNEQKTADSLKQMLQNLLTRMYFIARKL